MSLTVTPPVDYTPAFNPIIISAVSNVRDDYTIGDSKAITTVSAEGGYVQLDFDASHGLLKGDYILITDAPGAEYLIGISLITSIVDTDTVIIDKAYVTGLDSDATAWKYVNNYNAFLKFYVYVEADPTTPIYAASKTIKPYFESGVCKFRINMQQLVQEYNYDAYNASSVLSNDPYPIGSNTLIQNTKSFIKWGYELFEAFDNPAAGFPSYEEGIEATE